jgi:PleD family two-component response regulator
VHDADQALYRAKAEGRNRLALAPLREGEATLA